MIDILLVEDDVALSQTLVDWLSSQGYRVTALCDGQDASGILLEKQFDLIIVDWGLPTKSGVEICSEFRRNGGNSPIIVLTGRDGVDNVEVGLDSGADDFMAKPIELREFSARVRALLRRPQDYAGEVLHYLDIVLDARNGTVRVSDYPVELFPKEFALLQYFMRHPKEPFTPQQLLNAVWELDSDASIDTIYTYIKTLRRKISPHAPSSVIRTIHGYGYRLR